MNKLVYPFRLALVTNRHLVKDKPLIKLVESALKGGVDAVIIREPDLPPKVLVAIAREFRKLTYDFGAKLIIKDRIDVAQIVSACGVQLGADSISPTDAKKIWEGLIGYSAHSEEELRNLKDNVDYFILSPVFYTKSKPFARPLGVDRFVELARTVDRPVYPLGGIDFDRARELREKGVVVAVCMSIFYKMDPMMVAKRLREVLEGVS